MDCGAGEGSLELGLVRDLAEGDEGAGQARPDVGTHDHRDGRLHIQDWKKEKKKVATIINLQKKYLVLFN